MFKCAVFYQCFCADGWAVNGIQSVNKLTLCVLVVLTGALHIFLFPLAALSLPSSRAAAKYRIVPDYPDGPGILAIK